MPDAKTRHAAAQRRHAARLKANGVPRQDDLGRALLAALRNQLARNPTAAEVARWAPLLRDAARVLGARGFDPRLAFQRLKRAVAPRDRDY